MEVSRNRAALVAAAIDVLGARPEAGMADIAAAAGVTRQTAYAHFGSRDALLAAVHDEQSRRAYDVLEAADVADGTPAEALDRFLSGVAALLAGPPPVDGPEPSPDADAARHDPVRRTLESLIRRGRDSGAFDTALDTGWLVSATIALGHAAGEHVRSGLLDAPTAARQFRASVLLLYGVRGHGGTARP